MTVYLAIARIAGALDDLSISKPSLSPTAQRTVAVAIAGFRTHLEPLKRLGERQTTPRQRLAILALVARLDALETDLAECPAAPPAVGQHVLAAATALHSAATAP